MKVIYISHPYSDNPVKNSAYAHIIATFWAKNTPDTCFINPLDLMRPQAAAGLSYDDILSQCIEILKRCDAVIMAHGYEKSHGCKMELEAARKYKKNVYFITADFLIIDKPEVNSDEDRIV